MNDSPMEQRWGTYFLTYFALFNLFLAGIDTTASHSGHAPLSWQAPACAWYSYLATGLGLLLTIVVVIDFHYSTRRDDSGPLGSATLGE